jgi:hypothetical protein
MPKCEHCGYAVSGFECETCESCWECVGKDYDCEECHPPSKYNFTKSSKKCAGCSNNHDGCHCDGCGKMFCEECFSEFEYDAEVEYGDPAYPHGTMAGPGQGKSYCENCA